MSELELLEGLKPCPFCGRHHHQERAGIGLGYDAVRRPVLPLRRRWPEGLLVRWRRPEPCEGDGCGLLEREGKR